MLPSHYIPLNTKLSYDLRYRRTSTACLPNRQCLAMIRCRCTSSKNSYSQRLLAVGRTIRRTSYVRPNATRFILAAHGQKRLRNCHRLPLMSKNSDNKQENIRPFQPSGPLEHVAMHIFGRLAKKEIEEPVHRRKDRPVLKINQGNRDCSNNCQCKRNYIFLPLSIEPRFFIDSSNGQRFIVYIKIFSSCVHQTLYNVNVAYGVSPTKTLADKAIHCDKVLKSPSLCC